MKKSDIEIGKVYAYTRHQNPTSTYHISGFVVESLTPAKDWRGNINSQEVSGRFTKSDGTINPDANQTNVNIRRLIGEYLPLKHELEIRDKNKEIARLNQQIASTQIEGLIKANSELIAKRLDIKSYDIRNTYEGRATITLNASQFQRLVWDFKSLERHDEAERIEQQKRYEALNA